MSNKFEDDIFGQIHRQLLKSTNHQNVIYCMPLVYGKIHEVFESGNYLYLHMYTNCQKYIEGYQSKWQLVQCTCTLISYRNNMVHLCNLCTTMEQEKYLRICHIMTCMVQVVDT